MAHTPDTLRAFYDRRHPGYAAKASDWLFYEQTYRGGREWFSSNVFRYYKEGDSEYNDRLKRAYRFNHTKEVVELVQKYLFKGEITRNSDEAPEVVRNFWKSATRGGASIDQFMRLISISNAVGGRVAIVMDNNYRAPVVDGGVEVPVSQAQAAEQNYRVYAYSVPVRDILDFAYDEDGDGELLWVKLRETYRDDADPMTSSGDTHERVRLWTRHKWELYEEQATGVLKTVSGKKVPEKIVKLIDQGTHSLGIVPVYFADHTINESPYQVTGLIDDIAYLDRAIANYLSNLDAIIQDQTFSQLAIPSQALSQSDDMYASVVQAGTKRVFTYDGQGGEPKYLSPDPKQAGVILTVINKIINEIYSTVGLAGERTKQDNAVGIDNSSGVAKAYDFERVNSLLLAKAQSCQNAENWMVRVALAWHNAKPVESDLVTYPSTFDVMGLNDELITAETLGRLMAPPEIRREQMRGIVDKIFPQLKADLREKLMKNIEEWLDEAQLDAPPISLSGKSPAEPNRQGEVTKDTDTKDAA